MALLDETAEVAIDGSKFKAVNNRDKNFTKAKMDKRLGDIEKRIARYLAELDEADRCPAGEALTYRFTSVEKGKAMRVYWCNECGSCLLKGQCTTGKERRIKRWEHEAVLERSALMRLRTENGNKHAHHIKNAWVHRMVQPGASDGFDAF